jgi:hypothetical protein
LFTLSATQRVSGRRGWSPITYQLETRTNHHRPTQIKIDFCPASSAIGKLNSLDRPAWSGKLHPVEHRCEAEVSLRCRVHGAPYRRTGIQEILGSGESGSFRRTTQLCQVGTPAGDRSIQIQLPKSEATTEIEDRYPQTSIRWHESAPSAQYQPRLTMGGEYVKGPLKPISTATSDE